MNMNLVRKEWSWRAALRLLGLAVCASQVRAAVVFTCSVTTSGVSFGTYNPLSPTGAAAVGSWTVMCTAVGSGSATVAGTLHLSTGSSGQYATRTLVSGTNKLDYNIYLTPAYAQIIGNGTADTYALSASGTVTAGQVYQVSGNFYGFMPAGQDSAAGGYSDTLVVTVTY